MVGIYANQNKGVSVTLKDTLTKKFDSEGISYVNVVNAKDIPDDIDLLIVIGGDGTVLNVIDYVAIKNIPVLAVNAGSVGFLACVEGNELDLCLDYVKNGDYITERRPLLECVLNGKRYYALNEVSIQRKSEVCENGCTLALSLKIDGVFVDSFRADGIIIATPTGSTAYSLSAGGAILTPGISALIATPICAHTLRSKPIVFSDSAPAEIGLSVSSGEVYCDGKFVGVLNKEQNIIIRKSNLSAAFVKNKRNFYETLFKKLTFWSEN